MAEVTNKYEKEPENLPLEVSNMLGKNGGQSSGEGSKHRSKRKRLPKDYAEEERGVCYLSRVPPKMNPSHIRQVLSQYGDIQRIYLAPENATSQVQRKQSGSFRGKDFSEGWVEFTKKSVAKRAAKMLNGEQIGGKRRSPFYYDIWNIKYLSKFKWDNLIAESAIKKREQEEKLHLEISAADRERDFYISKVEQSRALKCIKERIKKKQKVEGKESGDSVETKFIRQFPQNKPVDDHRIKRRISKDILAGVFGSSSS